MIIFPIQCLCRDGRPNSKIAFGIRKLVGYQKIYNRFGEPLLVQKLWCLSEKEASPGCFISLKSKKFKECSKLQRLPIRNFAFY